MEGSEFYERVGGLRTSSTFVNGKDNEEVDNKEEFLNIIQHLDVLFSAKPEDKNALVTGLKELGEVVAVGAYLSEDVPALKKANVGFVKNLLKVFLKGGKANSITFFFDSFYSIVKSCMWGRNIYYSFRKTLQFQLTIHAVTTSLMVI